MDKLLAADEVAAILGVHRSSVLAFARAGALPVIRLGPRTVRFREQDVARFVDARTSVASS